MLKRYIITGAPGTGKTTLINALRSYGYSCFSEISRQVITQQQSLNTNKTPWGDLTGFADLVYKQTLSELQIPLQNTTFVDRGLPDLIAYLTAQSNPIPSYLLDFPFKTYYESTIFLTTPWKEIYCNDPQRPQSFQEAMRLHQYLIQAYQNLNFDIVLIPKTTLTKRVDFIRSFIESKKVYSQLIYGSFTSIIDVKD